MTPDKETKINIINRIITEIECAGYYLLECRENRYKPIDKMLKDWKEQRIETIYFKS